MNDAVGAALTVDRRSGEKIPSRATQLVERYAASAFSKLLDPQAVGSASDLYGTFIFSQEPVA